MTWLITGTIKNAWHVFCLSKTHAVLASYCLFVSSAYCNMQCKHRNEIFQVDPHVNATGHQEQNNYLVHRDWISLLTGRIFSKIQPIPVTFHFHTRKHLSNSVQHVFLDFQETRLWKGKPSPWSH